MAKKTIEIADKPTLDEVNKRTVSISESTESIIKSTEEINKSVESVQKSSDEIKENVKNVSVGIPPQTMKFMKASAANGKATLFFNEPDDVVIEAQTVCTTAGCVIRMSTEDYPETIKDGELVIDNTELGKYATDGYTVTGLENDTVYYFRAFPYSDHGVYNTVDCDENKAKCMPTESQQVTVSISTNNDSDPGEVTIYLTNVTDDTHSEEFTLSGVGEHTFFVPIGETYYISVSPVSLYVAPKQTEEYTADEGSKEIEMQYQYAPAFSDCSWELIKQVMDAGIYKDVWEIGDEKTILIGDTNYTIVIYDFDHDEKTAGGKAKITLGLKNSLVTTYQMNSTNTNAGGWGSCAFRTTLQGTILKQLPEELRNLIVKVNKKTSAGSQSTTINTTSDDLFLLSEIEIFGTTTYSVAGEGSFYPYFASATQRIKKLGDSGSAIYWWERSPIASGSTIFCTVGSSGTAYGNYNASTSHGASFGFCID